jgi:hypothetical protein
VAGAQVEARPVQPALDGAAVELALGQRDVAWVHRSSMACTSSSEVRTRATRTPSTSARACDSRGGVSSSRRQTSVPHAVLMLRSVGCIEPLHRHPPSSALDGRHEALCTSSTPMRPTTSRRSRGRRAGSPRTLGMPRAMQVEQLLVVESPSGAGVPGTEDLPRLDLEVRHRVGAGAVGEHEVAVQLVGVGALGAGSDEDVTDPHGVGRVALQGALVEDVGSAVGGVVVDEQAGARGAARRRRSRRRGPRTDPPGPAYVALVLIRTMDPPRVTAMCRTEASRPTTTSCWAEVDRVSFPLLDRHQGQLRPSPATVETSRCSRPACVPEHHGGLGTGSDAAPDEVAVDGRSRCRAPQ